MAVILRYFVFLLWIWRCESARAKPADPPVMRVLEDSDISSKYDVRVMKYPQASQEPDATSSDVKDDIDGVTVIPTYDKTLLEPEEDLFTNTCTFVFTLPNPTPRNQQVCVTDVRSMMVPTAPTPNNKEILRTLRGEIGNWQKTIERKLTSRHSSSGIGRIKNDVIFLKNESRNMNARIARLHMLLLNEIIRERDETIDLARLDNNILNTTIKYHELKDRHDTLVSDHKILKLKSEAQQDEIDYLQTRMTEMTDQLNAAVLKAEEATAWCKQAATMARRTVTDTASNVTKARSREPNVTYRDCTEVQRQGVNESGLHSLTIPSVVGKIKVWCDQSQDPGGWIVIQRRLNGKVNFYRNMQNYKRGFGQHDGDFWLGLENIHRITSQPDVNFKLHIDMEDWSGTKTFVEYGSFKIEGEDDGYRLKIGRYSGSAGDSLTWHNNMKFSAKNVDNDLFERSCANYQRGGWWYNACAQSNLNGQYYVGGHYRSAYQNGVYWSGWRGKSYSLKSVEMKIRPTE